MEYEGIIKALGALCDYHMEEGHKLYSIDTICDMIKLELNKIFPDFKCRRFVYNANTDKSFFGVFIKPDPLKNNTNYIEKIFAGLYDNGRNIDYDSFEPFKFESYEIEVDGKIFSSDILSPTEVWAILCNEICAMNTTRPIYQLRAMIDTFVAKSGMHIDLDKVLDSSETFYMVSVITLHNLSSMFAVYGEDVSDAYDITAEMGLSSYYKSAIDKLKENMEWQQPVADVTGLMLTWYLNHYGWIRENRDIEYIFRDSIDTEACKLVRQCILNALNQNVFVIATDNKYYKDSIHEAFGKKHGLIWQMKRNGIKSIEEDLFEYTMRVRNIETEDDAIVLMRQINSRMSILEDYLRDEDIDDIDRKRWEECYKQYVEIRTTLSKKTLYKRKQMGLWMDYNYLSPSNNDPSGDAYY